LKNPNVYIGSVKDIKWTTDPDPDDDRELANTPKDVVQILGFDPALIDIKDGVK